MLVDNIGMTNTLKSSAFIPECFNMGRILIQNSNAYSIRCIDIGRIIPLKSTAYLDNMKIVAGYKTSSNEHIYWDIIVR